MNRNLDRQGLPPNGSIGSPTAASDPMVDEEFIPDPLPPTATQLSQLGTYRTLSALLALVLGSVQVSTLISYVGYLAKHNIHSADRWALFALMLAATTGGMLLIYHLVLAALPHGEATTGEAAKKILRTIDLIVTAGVVLLLYVLATPMVVMSL